MIKKIIYLSLIITGVVVYLLATKKEIHKVSEKSELKKDPVKTTQLKKETLRDNGEYPDIDFNDYLNKMPQTFVESVKKAKSGNPPENYWRFQLANYIDLQKKQKKVDFSGQVVDIYGKAIVNANVRIVFTVLNPALLRRLSTIYKDKIIEVSTDQDGIFHTSGFKATNIEKLIVEKEDYQMQKLFLDEYQNELNNVSKPIKITMIHNSERKKLFIFTKRFEKYQYGTNWEVNYLRKDTKEKEVEPNFVITIDKMSNRENTWNIKVKGLNCQVAYYSKEPLLVNENDLEEVFEVNYDSGVSARNFESKGIWFVAYNITKRRYSKHQITYNSYNRILKIRGFYNTNTDDKCIIDDPHRNMKKWPKSN